MALPSLLDGLQRISSNSLREKKRGAELAVALMREKWVLFTVGYILCLGTFLGSIEPVVATSSVAPLITLLVLLAADYISSRSYPEGGID